MNIFQPDRCRYHSYAGNRCPDITNIKPAEVVRHGVAYEFEPGVTICMVCPNGFEAYNALDRSQYRWVDIPKAAKKRGRPVKPKFTKEIEL